ncbi:hypothetical protein RUND412_004510 [Rhizina undulata]
MTSNPHPIFNTTFTLHRLTPLHNFPSTITPPTLTPYAKTLLSLLRGDVIRGVRILADDDDSTTRAASTTGALKNVSCTPLPPLTWTREKNVGVRFEVVYEKISYSALLLPGGDEDTDMDGMTHFPLLMMRMPKGLRETLLRFLESSFDTLPLPVRLHPGILVSALESYLEKALDVGIINTNVQLTFSPPSIASPGLKSLTLTIHREDVERFYQRGVRLLHSRKIPGGRPFLEALKAYAIDAMGCKIDDLRLSKVACGAFVVGIGTGDVSARVKIFEPKPTMMGRLGGDGKDEIDPEENVVGDLMASLLRAALGEEREDSYGVGARRDGSVEL